MAFLGLSNAVAPVTADWREFAACIDQPELFFFDTTMKEAQAICGECPVSLHCKMARKQYERKFKAAHPGIWAGEVWAERNNVKQSYKARRIA